MSVVARSDIPVGRGFEKEKFGVWIDALQHKVFLFVVWTLSFDGWFILGFARKSYQFDFSDAEMALRQMDEDFRQGAEMAIVKPALPYLDVLQDACRRAGRPVAVYHVSGEYAMAMRAAKAGFLDPDAYFSEIHAAFARCGARYAIGYAADYFLHCVSD